MGLYSILFAPKITAELFRIGGLSCLSPSKLFVTFFQQLKYIFNKLNSTGYINKVKYWSI